MYKSGAHTRHRLRYHFVFVPKYRKRVLRGKISSRLKQLFYKAEEINDWKIEEIAVSVDHLHLLIQLNPADSVSQVVQKLKGGSSYILRKENPELEEFLWGDSFWSDGYFAETVGKVDSEMIAKYIREHNQSMPECPKP